tara:strand:+ start:371 stop:3142 length:2772 start_codon:yes stop_codon:yes gene_type:complete
MTINYRDTLNLPLTDFSMKAGLPKKEPEILNLWSNKDIYKKIRSKYKDKDFFLLHDGPPYANGKIHLGHSVNKILKDITIKHKTMLGFDAPFIPGWDCHGLPIELNVEKKHGKNSEIVKNKESFQIACKEYAETQIDNQLDDFKRLGVFGDWKNSYKSLDSKFEADIVRSLGIIYNAGHLEKGEKPVHWCQDCGSSLAEAEVEYIDKKSRSVDVEFKVDKECLKNLHDAFNIKDIVDISFVIWTTTPWTLPSNVAVCINPEIEYSLITLNKKFYVIASEMINQCMERWNTECKKISSVMGEKLIDIELLHPFIKRNSVLLHADHVTTESGTGCVHTAPAHGMDDHIICKKNNLKTINALNNKAFFKDELDFIKGLPAIKADPLIIEKLRECDVLVNDEDYHHSYPHCWRHKTPLIFTSTPQWFISMKKNNLIQGALSAIKEVKWEPSWGFQRIESMLNDRPDWCISRQRNWGVPITLVVHKETGDIHPKQKELFEKFASHIEENGLSSWDKLELKDYITDAEDYVKTSDSLDVWFDSGVTHYAVSSKRFGNNIVSDLYLEGSDQHRGWFQSSLLTRIAMNGDAPYKTVLTHGFVVDEQGRKQSKSLGNVVSPQKVWDNLGADILRLWVASTDFRSEMVASDEILKRTSDQYRRIRNTFRFILGNLYDYQDKDNIKFENQVELDKWIIIQAKNLQKDVLELYDSYSYHKAIQKIHNFCVNELGSIYLDIVKDRLYTCKSDSIARRSCQTSLDYLLNTLVRLVAPILSYTAEEIWQTSARLNYQEESVFLSNYDVSEIIEESSISKSDWKRIFEIKNDVNQSIEEMRNENKLKGSLDANVCIEANNDDIKILEKLGAELHFLFICSETDVKENNNFKIKVNPSKNQKCIRCWHRHTSVGTDKKHADLCKRCIKNIDGDGEQRSFV